MPAARWILLAAVILYLAVVIAEAARVARRHGAGVLPLLLLVFPTMHAAHGVGVWDGLLRNVGRGIARREPERLLAR
jgi:succinoglycan biosynthesis protein ExoA